MTPDDAHTLAMAYAWGREDASRTATAGGSPDRISHLAFARAFAQGWDDYNSQRRCSMNNVRSAYEHWQASEGRSVFAQGDLTLGEAERDELRRLRDAAWGWHGSKDTTAYYARQAELQDVAWAAAGDDSTDGLADDAVLDQPGVKRETAGSLSAARIRRCR